MEDQGVVVVVRLSDVRESDQPDPLCLRVEDLSKWRHLEALMLSMYEDPPQAIRVAYLDNEDDWIEISCDEELAEAVKITQQSDKILLFQVKRMDPLIYFESTLPPKSTPTPERPLAPQPEEERAIAAQPTLVYPLPSQYEQRIFSLPSCDQSRSPTHYPQTAPLIYPHPTTNPVTPNAPLQGPNENVSLVGANGKMASIENRPDLSTEEKISILKSKMSAESAKANQGLNSLSSGLVWEQASSLSSREKLKFLRRLVPADGELESDGVEDTFKRKPVDQPLDQALMVEPLCPEHGSSLGTNLLANQDPFETLSTGKPSDDLEQVQLPKPTLTPMKTSNQGHVVASTTQSVSLEIETSGPKYDQCSPRQEAVKAGATMLVARSSGQQPGAEILRPGKASVVPPVPLPRTLQMMEGAQSGANAVAIEIPESYHGASHKEEDVTASGGTSCTSASAETGEMLPDGIHHAAAVGREMKRVSDPSAVSAISSDSRIPTVQVPSHSKKQSSEGKKKSESRKSEHSGKRKESGSKDHSAKKRSSGEKIKKDASALKKEDKKVKADVESGEKNVSSTKNDTSSQYKDIVKYMRRMKKELHSNIVKDVTKQTDKLMKKNFERSLSYDSILFKEGLARQRDVFHTGVVCDCCNSNICGIRYKCGNCPDFDLCEKCEALPNVHDPTHTFVKLRRPVSNAGVEEPLLRENLFLCESVYEENWDKSSRLSRQLSEDISVTRRDNRDEELSKWFWDSAGTCEPRYVGADTESMRTLSRSEVLNLYKMLNSLEEAEGPISSQDEAPSAVVEECDKTPDYQPQCLSSPYVREEAVEQESVIQVQAEPNSCVENVVNAKEEEEEETGFNDPSVVDDEETSNFLEAENEDDNSEAENEGEHFETDGLDEVSGSLDENCNVTGEADDSSNVDSDSSDDFCIIDPPSREEFEACGMEFSSHPLINPCLVPETMSSLQNTDLIETDGPSSELPSFITIAKSETQEIEEKSVEEVVEESRQDSLECSNPPVSDHKISAGDDANASAMEQLPLANGEEVVVTMEKGNSCGSLSNSEMETQSMEQAVGSSVEDGDPDYLMEMTPEERKRFLAMVEDLKKRTFDLEQELKEKARNEVRSLQAADCQKETEVQLILEAKEKEAARENEKLERMNMKEVVEKLEKWQTVQETKKREESIRLQREKEKCLEEHAQKLQQNQTKTEAQSDVDNLSPVVSVTTGSYDNVIFRQARKDVDCQTNANLDPAAQASQVLQQISYGVSKAASSAYYTAKDVIHSLQAKQSEKKAPTSTSRSQNPVQRTVSSSDDSWTPPASVWTPAKNTFVPPKSNWTPSKQDWTPPKSEWTPPKSEWTPPASTYQPPASDYQPARVENPQRPLAVGQQKEKTETNKRGQDSPSSPTPLISTIPVADSALQKEMMALQRLNEMGFANREQNRKLLKQFEGDLEKVVQSLLQEEGGEHWAGHRH